MARVWTVIYARPDGLSKIYVQMEPPFHHKLAAHDKLPSRWINSAKLILAIQGFYKY